MLALARLRLAPAAVLLAACGHDWSIPPGYGDDAAGSTASSLLSSSAVSGAVTTSGGDGGLGSGAGSADGGGSSVGGSNAGGGGFGGWGAGGGGSGGLGAGGTGGGPTPEPPCADVCAGDPGCSHEPPLPGGECQGCVDAATPCALAAANGVFCQSNQTCSIAAQCLFAGGSDCDPVGMELLRQLFLSACGDCGTGVGVCDSGFIDVFHDECLSSECCAELEACTDSGAAVAPCLACFAAEGGPLCDAAIECQSASCVGICNTEMTTGDDGQDACLSLNCCAEFQACAEAGTDICLDCLQGGGGALCDDALACLDFECDA